MKKIITITLLFCATVFAQEIRRPTAEADTSGAGCTATNTDISSGMPNFYDAGGEGTSSTDSDFSPGVGTQTYKNGRRFSTIPAASGSYTTLNLIIKSSCVLAVGSGYCTLQYSTDGGTNFAAVTGRSATTWAAVTDTIPLTPTQNLTLVQVRWCKRMTDNASTGTRVDLTGYDIRTEGTLPASGARRRVITD